MWAQSTSIPYGGFPKGKLMKLHTNDIEMLKNKVPGIKYISPQNSRGARFGKPEPLVRNGKRGTTESPGIILSEMLSVKRN